MDLRDELIFRFVLAHEVASVCCSACVSAESRNGCVVFRQVACEQAILQYVH